MSDLGYTPDVPYPPPRRRAKTLLTPILATVAAAWLFAKNTPVSSYLRGFFSKRPKPKNTGGTSLLDQGLPLPLIRDTILGKGKTAVAALLGTPRTTGAPNHVKSDFWHTDIWYYPIETQSQTAMAVRFHNNIAIQIDFFEAPKST